jgi:malonate decarboxylase beta subunit
MNWIPVIAPPRWRALGGGIVTACCSRVVVWEHARISVTGPEVIETNKGVEEFDFQDRALVWRATGGET